MRCSEKKTQLMSVEQENGQAKGVAKNDGCSRVWRCWVVTPQSHTQPCRDSPSAVPGISHHGYRSRLLIILYLGHAWKGYLVFSSFQEAYPIWERYYIGGYSCNLREKTPSAYYIGL